MQAFKIAHFANRSPATTMCMIQSGECVRMQKSTRTVVVQLCEGNEIKFE